MGWKIPGKIILSTMRKRCGGEIFAGLPTPLCLSLIHIFKLIYPESIQAEGTELVFPGYELSPLNK